jgi:hypothetical protein
LDIETAPVKVRIVTLILLLMEQMTGRLTKAKVASGASSGSKTKLKVNAIAIDAASIPTAILIKGRFDNAFNNLDKSASFLCEKRSLTNCIRSVST